MEKTGKVILVIGATGQQGGAAAHHLLTTGWDVRAFTRNPGTPAAQSLRQAGAEVVPGDIAEQASLETAMRDVYGVFCALPHDDDEARQGKHIADVANAAGVQHFVYTSICRAQELY